MGKLERIKTVHSQRRYIVRNNERQDDIISLEKAVQIAKKHYGPRMRLADWCIDIGDAYTFSATLADGTVLTGGLALIVNKKTGARREVQYLPLPGYEFARRVNEGKRIDITELVQTEPERPEIVVISLEEAVAIAKYHFGESMTLVDYCIDTGESYTFKAINPRGSIFNGGRSVVVSKEVKSKNSAPCLPVPDYVYAALKKKGEKLNISKLIYLE